MPPVGGYAVDCGWCSSSMGTPSGRMNMELSMENAPGVVSMREFEPVEAPAVTGVP